MALTNIVEVNPGTPGMQITPAIACASEDVNTITQTTTNANGAATQRETLKQSTSELVVDHHTARSHGLAGTHPNPSL
jgi:hypothetical protein